MLFFTHVAFSVLIYFFFFSFNIFNFIFIIFGTIFPDIDSSSSKLGRKFKLVSFLFGHRKFFHSVFAAVFFSLLIYLFSYDFAKFFFIGYISHLFLDSFTKKGIKIFYPINYRISGFFKTGNFLEYFLFFILIILIIIVLL